MVFDKIGTQALLMGFDTKHQTFDKKRAEEEENGGLSEIGKNNSNTSVLCTT